MTKISLSIVVPVFNEQGNVPLLAQNIIAALSKQNEIEAFEIVFVDDASTDNSLIECKSISDKRIQVVSSSMRRGQTKATKLGIEAARYNVVATLDADLQNDPADFPAMARELNKGYDFVQGWRFNRNDPFVRKLSSAIANKTRRLFLKDNFHDISCSTRLFKKESVQNIEFFDGAHRFFPYLVQQQGFKVIECPVQHHHRTIGESKYNIRNRLFRAFSDMFRLYLKKKKMK